MLIKQYRDKIIRVIGQQYILNAEMKIILAAMAYKDAKIIRNETDADRLMNRYFATSTYKGFVEIGEDKYCLPIAYTKWAEKFHNFEVRNDDVFVAGCARTGTTWTQEMVWLILNDLDYEGAKEKTSTRVPFFEMDVHSDNAFAISDYPDMVTHMSRLKSPRCLKTHLHWSLLPKEIVDGTKCPKIICTLRNPKDTCVSLYHFNKLLFDTNYPFEDLCTLFIEGRVVDGPFWKTVLSFWKQRYRPNLFFVRYKDMIEDINSIIKQVATFLGKELSDDQVELLAKHLNIETMRRNPGINNKDSVEKFRKASNTTAPVKNEFIRNGKQGGYVSVMSPELIEKFDEWTKKHLEGTDLVVE